MKDIDENNIKKFMEMRAETEEFLKTGKYGQTEILKVELKGEQALAFRMLKALCKREDYPLLARKIIELGLRQLMNKAEKSISDLTHELQKKIFKNLF